MQFIYCVNIEKEKYIAFESEKQATEVAELWDTEVIKLPFVHSQVGGNFPIHTRENELPFQKNVITCNSDNNKRNAF